MPRDDRGRFTPAPELGSSQILLRLAEIQPGEIPLSQAVSQAQYDRLISGDDDPCEVVAEVAPGDGGRGWHYGEDVLRKIVTHVDQFSLSGMLGHQRKDDLGTEFPTPVTHWVGAKWQDGRAMFRGVVDKTAPDLKRWLRAGRVTQPSIFTDATVDPRSNKVLDLKPLSIDWAPLGRAGMKTAHVSYVSEMNGASYMATGEMLASDSTSQGGQPPVTQTQDPPTLSYAELLQQVRTQNTSKTALARDLGLTASDALGLFSTDELVAAASPELKAAIVGGSGEMAAFTRFHGELAAAVHLPVEVKPDALVEAIKANQAALDALSSQSLATTVAGGVGEMQLSPAIRPLLIEKVAARLTGQRDVTVDLVKTTAGEIMASDTTVKALLDGHFGGGTPTPPSGSQSNGGSRTPTLRESLASAGFVVQAHRI